jgi:hypothetical protein
MHYSYLARGVYVDQLARWQQFFPREQMLVLQSEMFYDDPAATLYQVKAFLGLDRQGPGYAQREPFRKYNVAEYPPMQAATRERLAAYFAPHNEKLYQLLGQNLGW